MSRHRQYQFPNLLEAFFLVVLLFLIEMLTNALVSGLCRSAGLQTYHIASIARVLACGVLFTVLLHHSGRSYGALLHEGNASVGATLGLFVVPILLAAPGLLLADTALMWLVGLVFPFPQAEWTMFNAPFGGKLGAIVLVCAIAPCVEEMLFRGVMLRSFLQQYPRNIAIVHSAGVFGMAHMNVHQFMLAFLLGLLLGKLYERTRSLLPSILVHCCVNTGVTIMGFVHADDPGTSTDMFRYWSMEGITLSIASGAVGGWMLYRLLRTTPARSAPAV